MESGLTIWPLSDLSVFRVSAISAPKPNIPFSNCLWPPAMTLRATQAWFQTHLPLSPRRTETKMTSSHAPLCSQRTSFRLVGHAEISANLGQFPQVKYFLIEETRKRGGHEDITVLFIMGRGITQIFILFYFSFIEVWLTDKTVRYLEWTLWWFNVHYVMNGVSPSG